MTKNICILGRQAGLSLAELESLLGSRNVTPFGPQLALTEGNISHTQIGGTVKVATLLAKEAYLTPDRLQQLIRQQVRDIAATMPEGKIKLGVSIYGQKTAPRKVGQIALSLKKELTKAGRSVRVVPNTHAELSSAQVGHNKLTAELGIELIIGYGPKNQVVIGRTTSVQDINAYSKRDFERPKRDAVVGMLPPKLAQIMLNLAQTQPGQTVLDPFCGTGVLLMEATLHGCRVQGTDLQPRMIDYSAANLAWLSEQLHLPIEIVSLEQGDARNHQWQPFDHIVCESYLGKPLSSLPPKHTLQPIMAECNTLITDFLQNAAAQMPSGTRCVIGVPAWVTKNGLLHLPVIDQLSKIGYNRTSFMHASSEDLVYHREDQVVARELLVLTRN